jgi:lipopolysaccharide/colanic/teichoic acid biosynthesis glycosyltransferase
MFRALRTVGALQDRGASPAPVVLIPAPTEPIDRVAYVSPPATSSDELNHSEVCTWLAKYPARSTAASKRYLRLKRATDLTIVSILAPLWLPLVGLVALLIAVGSGGAPVLFRQHRTGRDLRRFVMYKFRTMVPNADELKAQLQHLNQRTWPDFKIDPDPRVTRLGRLLRKTSLDELPQLINVLRGDMSLVRPRPTSLAPDAYESWQLARFSGPVGITGVWQVAGRGHPSFVGRVRLDLNYLERACWRLDAEILLRTIPGLLQRKGA